MPLCLAASRHKGQRWKGSVVRFVDTDSGFCFWLMEQEIQTCRFNSAWKAGGGASIHSSRRPPSYPPPRFLLPPFRSYFCVREICFFSQRSAGLCLHLHMLSSDVDTQPRLKMCSWDRATSQLQWAENAPAPSEIPSEVPPLASGYIRHLVGFFFHFLLSWRYQHTKQP